MHNKQLRKQAGMALIAVLCIVMTIAMIASSFVMSTRRDIRTTQIIKTQTALSSEMTMYLNLAKFWLAHPDIKQRWLADGRIYQIRQPGQTVRIQISSENGKCDINTAETTLLQAIMKLATNDQKIQKQLVDKLTDWRDEDDERLDFGAESLDYLRKKFNYVPNNQAFESIDDLLMVMDFDETILDKIRPFITVYSGQANINYQTASIAMLRLLKQDFAERQIQDTELDKELDFKLFPVKINDDTTEEKPISIDPDQVYNVVIEAKTLDKASYSLETFIKTQAEDSVFWPFQTLDWKINQLKISLFQDQLNLPVVELSNEFTD